MTEEEYSILDYLKRSPGVSFNRKEIARKAVRRAVFEENPHWVDHPLAALVAGGVVEIDDSGLYRLKKWD
jgi:DNA-binding response OmpR family regulator